MLRGYILRNAFPFCHAALDSERAARHTRAKCDSPEHLGRLHGRARHVPMRDSQRGSFRSSQFCRAVLSVYR